MLNIIHANEIVGRKRTEPGQLYILQDGTVCQAIVHSFTSGKWKGYYLRSVVDVVERTLPPSFTFLNKEDCSSSDYIVLVRMGTNNAPPVRRVQLEKGTAFRYLGVVDKKVYYIPPRHMLMPRMVAGEHPVESTGDAKGDNSPVEILWTPKHFYHGKWGDRDASQLHVLYEDFMKSRDIEIWTKSRSRKSDISKLSNVLNMEQLEIAQTYRAWVLHNMKLSAEEKERNTVSCDPQYLDD